MDTSAFGSVRCIRKIRILHILEHAYHNLITVLSIIELNVTKPNHAWAKSPHEFDFL